MPETKLPEATHIGRVTLRVGSLDDVLPFYREAVGLAVLDETDDGAVLGTEETSILRLVEAPTAPKRPRDAAGLFHLAIRVPDRGALADALERVKDRSTLTGASDHIVSEALYLRDPEGNGVEIYSDRPRAEWRTTGDGRVVMDTLPLDQQALHGTAHGDDRLPPGTDMGHVHLEVTDLPRSVAFYRDTLGMNLRDDSWEGAAFLAAGEYHHHVGLNTWNQRREPLEDSRGLVSFELLLPDEATLGAAIGRLDADGLAVDRGGHGATVVDPDGIRITLGHD